MPTSLTTAQCALLEGWLPGYAVLRDLSWGLVETTVLEVSCAGERFVVKAGGPQDHHMAREVRALQDAARTWP